MKRKGRKERWFGVAAFIGAVLLVGGCATTGGSESAEKVDGSGSEPKKEKVEIDPMLIRGGKGKKPPKTVDSKDVFDKAYEAYSARRYEEAVAHYEMIVRYFDESRFFRPALYNGGLAYEKLERWESAARMYRRIIEEFPKEKDTTDAYYRLAQVYKQQGRHQEIVELMTQAMLRDDLSTFDRVEAHTRRSNALIEVGELEDAEQGFSNLLKINREAAADERLPSNSRYIVQAYFGLGKIYQKRQSQIQLTLPPETMGDDLEKKGELLLRAQHYFLKALRQHHPHWSVASGYMIGRLYEDFYSDIFSAEVPEDLTKEQVAMYFEELRSKIRPLMKRAIKVYKKNLSLSRRIGETTDNNKWVAETSEALQRMKAYLNNPVTQKQAEQLALKGQDFRVLWRPYELAGEAVDEAVTRAVDEIEKSSASASSGE